MDEIIENLYVGNLPDAISLNGKNDQNIYSICVLETRPVGLPSNSTHIPFLIGSGFPLVDIGALNLIAETVDNFLKVGQKVLLHCGAGIERSPLATIWFLHKKRGMTLDSAFQLVKEKRPIIQDRRHWLKNE